MLLIIRSVLRVMSRTFSGVNSSSLNWMISLIDRRPSRSCRPISISSFTTTGQREIVLSTSSWPRYALGDSHLAFTRQERDNAHLAKICAYGVVGLVQWARFEADFDLVTVDYPVRSFEWRRFSYFEPGVRRLSRRSVFVDFDAVALEAGEESINLLCRMLSGGKDAIQLIRE